MTKAKPRVSSTNITVDAPIVLYENSPEAQDLNPSYVRLIAGNVVGPFLNSYQSSDGLDTGEENGANEDDDSSGDGSDTGETGNGVKLAPELSDIELVSNEVVYDAAGNPTAKVTFKVKNSSGQDLKAINVKVQVA